MSDAPEDLHAFLDSIDQDLKDKGIKPHQRGAHAIIEFGRRFHLSLPFSPIKSGTYAPKELLQNNHYTIEINRYFEELYGAAQLVDPAEKSCVSVLADGDIWQLPIPIIWGEAMVTLSRDFFPTKPAGLGVPVIINPCQELVDITPKRLKKFSTDDLNEVSHMFNLGFNVKEAFNRFRNDDYGFTEAENDWFTSVLQLTMRNPAYGQSNWSSLQMVEKFMKALLRCIGDASDKEIRKCSHNLDELHSLLKRSIYSMDLTANIALVKCSPQARYGEISVSRSDAYNAHKAAMEIVSKLGSLQ